MISSQKFAVSAIRLMWSQIMLLFGLCDHLEQSQLVEQ
jgi:hypothetical protein